MPHTTHGHLVNRARSPAVALETTLLVHGLPGDVAMETADRIDQAIMSHGANPALIGVVRGRPTVGMTRAELEHLINADSVPKLNTSNLGLAIHARTDGATTVSATMELAELAGIRVFATGGIGGVHTGYAERLDISADLGALARHRVAVVTSGCKNILDLSATREALETLGVPVIGYQTDRFPAFYQRHTELPVDASFDDAEELADYIGFELARAGRGVVIANPIPKQAELDAKTWNRWLAEAKSLPSVKGATGRDATPALLEAVHTLSEGKTIEANIELVISNASLAARISRSIASRQL